jgi:hypothetical protein
MINSVNLLLCEQGGQVVRQFLGRRRVAPKRLFYDDSCPSSAKRKWCKVAFKSVTHDLLLCHARISNVNRHRFEHRGRKGQIEQSISGGALFEIAQLLVQFLEIRPGIVPPSDVMIQAPELLVFLFFTSFHLGTGVYFRILYFDFFFIPSCRACISLLFPEY